MYTYPSTYLTLWKRYVGPLGAGGRGGETEFNGIQTTDQAKTRDVATPSTILLLERYSTKNFPKGTTKWQEKKNKLNFYIPMVKHTTQQSTAHHAKDCCELSELNGEK